MAYRAPWDLDEAVLAKEMLDSGASMEAVARALDRTVHGVEKAMFRFFGPRRSDAVDRYTVGPPIGLTMEDRAREKSGQLGSAALANAINHMLSRMDPQERADCLGSDPQRAPGSEIIYKTSSISRFQRVVLPDAKAA